MVTETINGVEGGAVRKVRHQITHALHGQAGLSMAEQIERFNKAKALIDDAITLVEQRGELPVKRENLPQDDEDEDEDADDEEDTSEPESDPNVV